MWGMKIEVILLCKRLASYEALIKKTTRQLAGFLREKGKIELYITNDNKIKDLNKRFRKKDKPTNVLSFITPNDFPDDVIGEVYVNPSYIKKNKEDLTLMIVHGVLHILGYDHIKNSDKIKMERKEAGLLSKIRSTKP